MGTRPFHLSKPSDWVSPTQANLSVQLSILAGRNRARWGQLQGRGLPALPAPSTLRQWSRTISGVLKEPPGFAHLTGNKRPMGRLGFCSEVCFLSASSPAGKERHIQLVFEFYTSFLNGTQTHKYTCPQPSPRRLRFDPK